MKKIKDKNVQIIDNTFCLDKELWNTISWGNFTLREIKSVAGIYSKINPESKELKPIRFTAKEFCELCGISGEKGCKYILDLLSNIKKQVFTVYRPAYYNMPKDIKEALLREEALKSEYEDNSYIMLRNDLGLSKELFPMEPVVVSLIGSAKLVCDQENDASVQTKVIEITFDDFIDRHVLFARNVERDENGKVVGGIEQYYGTKISYINAFKNQYSLKLYMELLKYNGINKTYTWEDLKGIIGKKTQKANEQTMQRVIDAQVKAKIENRELKRREKSVREFNNFKNNALKNAVQEINDITGMDLSFTCKLVNGEYKITFNNINHSYIKYNANKKKNVDIDDKLIDMVNDLKAIFTNKSEDEIIDVLNVANRDKRVACSLLLD